jgi:hypothetical protein
LAADECGGAAVRRLPGFGVVPEKEGKRNPVASKAHSATFPTSAPLKTLQADIVEGRSRSGDIDKILSFR